MPAFPPVSVPARKGLVDIPDFSSAQPLVLDLGCGSGVFLAGLAAAQPGWNILGIEKKDYGEPRAWAMRASCMER
jgi:tRNA G46 methylase TrmB